MTQELVDRLISHYERVIKEIDLLDFAEARSVCIKNDVHYGICHLALQEFNEDIYQFDDWSNSQQRDTFGYFYEVPFFQESKEKVVECLQYRVDLMKTFK